MYSYSTFDGFYPTRRGREEKSVDKMQGSGVK